MLATAALLTAVVYIFTPLTAAGQEGSPTGFFTNTRYLIPGLVLALALLPIARPLRAPDKRAWQTLLFLTVVYAITVLTTPRWYPGYIVGTDLPHPGPGLGSGRAGAARVRGQVSRGWSPRRRRAVLLLAVVLGRAQEVQYDEHHYTKSTLFLQDGGPRKAYEFARSQHDKRIGIAGSGEIFFGQYGFYGADLDNYVQYIGVPGPDGAYRLATTCRQFRRPINEGDYDYLIISQFTQDSPDAPILVPDLRLGERGPGAEADHRRAQIIPQPDYVFKVNGKLDPAGCANLAAPSPTRRAPVAQWTEQLPSKQRVAGSNPAGGCCAIRAGGWRTTKPAARPAPGASAGRSRSRRRPCPSAGPRSRRRCGRRWRRR